MKLVTVHRSFDAVDAQLVRSCLDAGGIEAVVMNELSALSIDGYSMAAGGVLVQVREEDFDAARELLGRIPPLPEDKPE